MEIFPSHFRFFVVVFFGLYSFLPLCSWNECRAEWSWSDYTWRVNGVQTRLNKTNIKNRIHYGLLQRVGFFWLLHLLHLPLLSLLCTDTVTEAWLHNTWIKCLEHLCTNILKVSMFKIPETLWPYADGTKWVFNCKSMQQTTSVFLHFHFFLNKWTLSLKSFLVNVTINFWETVKLPLPYWEWFWWNYVARRVLQKC